jgi:hypothetical protein
MRIIFLLGLVFFTSLALSATVVPIPFQNYSLLPNETIQSPYQFGGFSVLFCFSNNTQFVGVITWPYQGQTMSNQLPITLVTNPIYTGSFADPAGTITIFNNQTVTQVISCIYAY